MSTFQQFTALGNVGNDPEIKATAGSRVASFSLATSEKFTTATGAKEERTQWHRCVAWNNGNRKLADVIGSYVKKGDKILVAGKVEYRQWTDKDGNKRYSTEIVVRDVTLVGGRRTPGEAVPAAVGASAGNGDFEDFPGALNGEDDDLPF